MKVSKDLPLKSAGMHARPRAVSRRLRSFSASLFGFRLVLQALANRANAVRNPLARSKNYSCDIGAMLKAAPIFVAPCDSANDNLGERLKSSLHLQIPQSVVPSGFFASA